MKPGCNVAILIERYFTDRLMRQRNVSADTIASNRDTFRLLFEFAHAGLRKAPSALTLDELDAPWSRLRIVPPATLPAKVAVSGVLRTVIVTKWAG